MSALASFDFTNPEKSVDAIVENYVASKYPNLATLHPRTAAAVNVAIEADVALAAAVLEDFALAEAVASAEKVVGPILDSIAAKVPALAPEISAIKAKIAASLPVTPMDWLAELFGVLVASLLNFEGQRADVPVTIKDAVHDKPLEDEFDQEIHADIAAGLVGAPGAAV